MRKRPHIDLLKDNFIDAASANVEENVNNHKIKPIQAIDYHIFVTSDLTWPFDKDEILPSYAEGSHLKKPITVNITEKEWNTIDRHILSLDVSKNKWLKRAIFKQLYLEQMNAFKAK